MALAEALSKIGVETPTGARPGGSDGLASPDFIWAVGKRDFGYPCRVALPRRDQGHAACEGLWLELGCCRLAAGAATVGPQA